MTRCPRCRDLSKSIGVYCPECKQRPHVFDLTWREIATLLVILPLADVALDSTVVGSLIDKGLVTSERSDESDADEVYITDAGRKVIDQFQRIV